MSSRDKIMLAAALILGFGLALYLIFYPPL